MEQSVHVFNHAKPFKDLPEMSQERFVGQRGGDKGLNTHNQCFLTKTYAESGRSLWMNRVIKTVEIKVGKLAG